MEYDYKLDIYEDHAVVKMPKKVMMPYSKEFKLILQSAYDQGCNIIILDCEHLQMFDTVGISGVSVYHKRLKDRGGELKLINVANDHIKEMFRTINLDTIVSIEEI